MLIELYFASRFVLIGNARIDWRRAAGVRERLLLVLHATRQAFITELFIRLSGRERCFSWMERESRCNVIPWLFILGIKCSLYIVVFFTLSS